jgi:hypothetical protein
MVMVMRGGVILLVSIPFHSKNFGQIFNDDVTVYSPPRLFSSSIHGTLLLPKQNFILLNERFKQKILSFY